MSPVRSSPRRAASRALAPALVLLALAQLSCAAGNLSPAPVTMPAARAALRPEYRIFYDALQDQGDWVLIEPYGYLFRPDVNFVAWRPYADGFWAPSDAYGWVWVSAEPFGWATYHYGDWLYDRFQGWLWMPGLDWGPAWVSWEANDQYVGWAPLMARSPAPGTVPGGLYNFVPLQQLPNADLAGHIVTAAQVPIDAGALRRVENLTQRDGVKFDRGPSIDLVERAAGPLTRTRIEDLLAPGAPAAAPGSGRLATPGRAAGEAPVADEVAATRRAAAEAARAARAIVERGGTAPARLPVVRPIGVPAAGGKPAPRPARRAPDQGQVAPADSSR
ncbi:MAG: hypothetical protein A2W00_12870 [Candidatus Eisenbacteria bacterium RBG_16_71_46]|nr:MAG: hypothetical protein A2W00_12870 [Candidatus Eisenbacteria bacterium RBG_16_71_46]